MGSKMTNKQSLFDRPFWVEPVEGGSYVLNTGHPGGTTTFHNGEAFINRRYGFTNLRDLLAFLSAENTNQPEPEFQLSDAQIEHMVNRFLGWQLPEDFRPDCGIQFKPTYNENTPFAGTYQPWGTNLFNSTQARQMVLYMTDGLPRHDH